MIKLHRTCLYIILLTFTSLFAADPLQSCLAKLQQENVDCNQCPSIMKQVLAQADQKRRQETFWNSLRRIGNISPFEILEETAALAKKEEGYDA